MESKRLILLLFGAKISPPLNRCRAVSWFLSSIFLSAALSMGQLKSRLRYHFNIEYTEGKVCFQDVVIKPAFEYRQSIKKFTIFVLVKSRTNTNIFTRYSFYAKYKSSRVNILVQSLEYIS